MLSGSCPFYISHNVKEQHYLRKSAGISVPLGLKGQANPAAINQLIYKLCQGQFFQGLAHYMFRGMQIIIDNCVGIGMPHDVLDSQDFNSLFI
jgi:hypothetical protein